VGIPTENTFTGGKEEGTPVLKKRRPKEIIAKYTVAEKYD
jgi:hypothetical protein